MKHLFFAVISIALFTVMGYREEDKPKSEPESEEYFSFYADGELFYYPQVRGFRLIPWQTLKVYGLDIAGYIIRGYSLEEPTAGRHYIYGSHIPDKDTIILDGGRAKLTNFKFMSLPVITTTHTEKGVLIFFRKDIF